VSRRKLTHCGRGHPFDEANTHWYEAKDGHLRRVCRKCAKMRNPFRERLYGVSRDDYAELLVEQNNVCALCGTDPGDRALAVDHDHRSGSIRGLLCSTCNTGLGALRDDPQLLRRAISYLEAHARGGDPAMAQAVPAAPDREQLSAAFEMVLDGFTTDVEGLAEGDRFEDTLMWTHLPDTFLDRYDVRFAVRFLLGVALVRERLADGAAFPATCVAEELALNAVLRTAIADAAEMGDVSVADRLEAFAERVLPDSDFALLFDREMNLSREQALTLGASHLWYEDWFRPFSVSSPGQRSALN